MEYIYAPFPTQASRLEVQDHGGPYHIRVTTTGTHLLLIMGNEAGTPGAAFAHPNIIRSRPEEYHHKHSTSFGNRWTTTTGTTHLLAIPRNKIELRLSVEHSWPIVRIAGHEIRLNVSGGGCSDWTDWIEEACKTCLNYPVRVLRDLAEIAERGTSFETYEMPDEQQARFYRENAGRWIVVSAVGDWHQDVPAGMVGVHARIDGHRGDQHSETRLYLVPGAEYAIPFVVDPSRHQTWATGK